MPHTYFIRLRTKKNDLTQVVLKRIINLLNSKPFTITLYDKVERCKKNFSQENIEDIARLFKSLILMKGKNSKVSVTVKASLDSDFGIVWWTFFVNSSKKITEDFFKEIIEFITLFNAAHTIIYGFMTSDKEYKYLHEDIVYYDDGSRVDGMAGVSMKEFSEFLPGIYWFNIFGKELSESLDIRKVKSIPNAVYSKIGREAVAFYLNEPIDVETMEIRGPKLYGIAKYLGAEYFFNIVNRDETTYRHPLKFRQYLEKIKEEYSQRNKRNDL